VFPELFLAFVVIQFGNAREFVNETNKIIDGQNDERVAIGTQMEDHHGRPASSIDSHTREEHWDFTTAFFGIMGGFEAKFSDHPDVSR